QQDRLHLEPPVLPGQLLERLPPNGGPEVGLGRLDVPGHAAVQPVRGGQVHMEVDRAQRHRPILPYPNEMQWPSRYAAETFFGTHMHQASTSSSRSSSTSSAASRARTHWYRSSLGSGIMNVSGRLATR